MLLGCPCTATGWESPVHCGTVAMALPQSARLTPSLITSGPHTSWRHAPCSAVGVQLQEPPLHPFPLGSRADRGVIATGEKESKPGGTMGGSKALTWEEHIYCPLTWRWPRQGRWPRLTAMGMCNPLSGMGSTYFLQKYTLAKSPVDLFRGK